MHETSRRHDSSRSAIAAALVAGLVALAGCASAPRGKIMPPAVAESDSTKKDARDATAADLTCTVEGCAGKFGLIDGCSCSIVHSAGVDVSNLESRGH